ncbi:MAG: hypothetical protein AAF416_12350 [Pseudomonadota bacterium]
MTMKYYLVRCDYNASAWNELLAQGKIDSETRLDPVTKLAERLGGRFGSLNTDDGPIIAKWVPFGSTDLLAVVQFEDDRNARAFSIAISAEPGVKNVEMTPMLHFHEAVDAINAAGATRNSYAAPGRGAYGD